MQNGGHFILASLCKRKPCHGRNDNRYEARDSFDGKYRLHRLTREPGNEHRNRKAIQATLFQSLKALKAVILTIYNASIDDKDNRIDDVSAPGN